MWRIAPPIAGLLVAIFLQSQAQAVVIVTNATALVPPIASGAQQQNLEDQLNTLVLNPLGIVVEFAAIDGGTSSVDGMAFEGPGLTGIGGSGFILRFDTPASNVRIRFLNFKDDGARSLFGFDSQVDYVRSTTVFSQSADGNVIGNPTEALAIDSATGSLPSGNDVTGLTGFLDLTVSDAGGISSIFARTNFFLWSLGEIDVTFLDTTQDPGTSSVPEPGALALFGVGLLGLGALRRRRKAA